VFTLYSRDTNLENEYVILGEETLLELMFANLIKNGIEASPVGGSIRISIDTVLESGQAYYLIDIHNRGIVPMDIRERFFDPYTTSGKEDGTGLGTHNALLVARTHKGDIRFTTSKKVISTLNCCRMITIFPKRPLSVFFLIELLAYPFRNQLN
jgi:signal transduction histidine kinase